MNVEIMELGMERTTNEHEYIRMLFKENKWQLYEAMYEKYFNAEAQRRKDAENAVFSYCAFSIFEISTPPRLCASALKVHII